jgi:5-hydroxyisourate hydrolase
VTETRPTISTHVLDTASGQPAAGVPVRLWRTASDGGSDSVVGEAITDADGRVPDLLEGRPLESGAYRLEFGLDEGGFFTGLWVDLRIDDPGRSYHVPLLRAPFGLSTYRGS